MKRIFLPVCAGLGLLFFGCAKLSLKQDSELDLNADELYLFYDETFQFEITKGGEPASLGDYIGTSSDPLVGYLDEANLGRFVARRIGTTTVTFTGGKKEASAQVTINPYYTLFEEPYFGFGASMDALKGNESRTVRQEQRDYIWYRGENADLLYVDYSFDDTGLNAVFLDISSAGDMIDKLLVFYKERYDYMDRYQNGWWFEDSSKQLYIVIEIDELQTSGGILVTYFLQGEDNSVAASMSTTGRPTSAPVVSNLPRPKQR